MTNTVFGKVSSLTSEVVISKLDGKYSERVQLPAKVCPMVLLTYGAISAFRYVAYADCGYD